MNSGWERLPTPRDDKQATKRMIAFHFPYLVEMATALNVALTPMEKFENKPAPANGSRIHTKGRAQRPSGVLDRQEGGSAHSKSGGRRKPTILCERDY